MNLSATVKDRRLNVFVNNLFFNEHPVHNLFDMMDSRSRDLSVMLQKANVFLVAKLLYKYLCPSVRMSVCLRSGLGGNVIFSASN